MGEMKIYIDNIEVIAKKGDTILTAARRAGVYIPTLCYLQKCEPIASCRLCVVEVEGQNGLILACQTKAVDGLKVIVNSEKLQSERTKIMELYCVNHPLECGVCDKSGECDLQNKTLEFGVDAQKFMAKEQKREIQNWQFIQYDPSLCVLCEKCVHVCNEIIGDDAIAIKYGGYKSSIIPKKSDTLDCTFCAECVAVCPVGALVSKDFKYKSNAWELKKTPSSCSHCSSACHIYYETKHNGTEKKGRKIYRVTNDFDFSTLCHKGRFDFAFANDSVRDDKAFESAKNALRMAKAIRFTSNITNEEALILQKLKEKTGIKLINNDALSYKNFIDAYSKASGNLHYSADLTSVKNSDFIVVLGTKIANDNPLVRYAINEASKKKNAEVVYAHSIEDALMAPVVTKYIKYEPASENGVMAILANMFADKGLLRDSEKEYFEEMDLGYVSSECSFDEEEQEAIKKSSNRKTSPVLILGSDLFSHPKAIEIAKFAGVLERSSNFKILIIPSMTNTLGVSLICDIDGESDYGFTVGYNTRGDYELSSSKASDETTLAVPALNQQEGTFTNIDKRVVPLSVALDFDCYCLNDLVNALDIGFDKKYTVEYTRDLPVSKGYISVDFDSLNNCYLNDGRENRGYILIQAKTKPETQSLAEIDSIGEMNGVLVYCSNPPLGFSMSSKYGAKKASNTDIIIGSKAFMAAAKVTNGANIEIEAGGKKLQREFVLDTAMKGTIALLQEGGLDGYKICKAKIISVES